MENREILRKWMYKYAKFKGTLVAKKDYSFILEDIRNCATNEYLTTHARVSVCSPYVAHLIWKYLYEYTNVKIIGKRRIKGEEMVFCANTKRYGYHNERWGFHKLKPCCSECLRYKEYCRDCEDFKVCKNNNPYYQTSIYIGDCFFQIYAKDDRFDFTSDYVKVDVYNCHTGITTILMDEAEK